MHIFFGKSKPDDPRRIEEIRAVSEALAKRNERRHNIADGEPESVVLLGDFSIFNAKKDETAKALQKNKFVVPKALLLKPSERIVSRNDEADGEPLFTNVPGDKHFDQIAFHDPKRRLQASKGGVFDFQQVIYGPTDAETYRSAMERSAPDKFAKASASAKELESFYRQWRTFQVSDHLPLWVELKTDFADAYLASVMHGKKSALVVSKTRKEAEATSPVETPPPIADAPKKLKTSTVTEPMKKGATKAKKVARKVAAGTALALALFFTPLMTAVVQGQTSLTMAPGDEKEICTGVKASVTPIPPKFGELRTGDSKDSEVHIFYKAKDTSGAVNETLTCTVGAQKQTVNIAVTPKRSTTSGFSDEAYPEAFKALFLLFVLAIVLESALAFLFNWRPFVETFNSRAVKPPVSLAFSLALVYMFQIDLVTSLAKLISPHVPALDDTGRILTAMVIAGGSAAVNNLMVGLGFRQPRTPDTVAPKPPQNTGWISVSIIRTDKIEGPVTVSIGVADATTHQVPVVASLDRSTTPAYRYFFRDRGRFPGSGGYAVAKGDNVTVKVNALKTAGSDTLEKTWGPNIVADGAIIDLTFTMTE